MRNIILTFGAISGTLTSGVFMFGSLLAMGGGATGQFNETVGYGIMLVALSIIFVGVKRYRDRELGGVIRFHRALLVGLGISAVAGVIYVAGWEIYLGMTDYSFIGEYTQAVIEGKKASGVTGEELEELIASMESMKENYANPLFRLPITFLEIFPVGLIISLISAAILRNSKVLPATA